MIDVDQFRALIVDRTLHELALFSAAASNLLLGTALVESRLTWMKQLGAGPALGFFQMEPATHDDIWQNYLHFNDDLAATICDLVPGGWDCTAPGQPDSDALLSPSYAAAMCRLHYRRVPEQLPDTDDLPGLASYWKRHYNTELGKGDPADFVSLYQQHIEA